MVLQFMLHFLYLKKMHDYSSLCFSIQVLFSNETKKMTNVCIQIELATAVILNEERKNFIFDVVCMEKILCTKNDGVLHRICMEK